MSGWSRWWTARSRREQRLLGVMILLLVLVLGWLLLVRPLSNALEEARLRHNQAVVALAEARAETASRPNALPGASVRPAAPIDSLVSRTAAEAGFADAQIVSMGPTRARASIASARAPAFFAWVEALERQGASVERLRATTNPDRTLTTDTLFTAPQP